MKKFYLIIIIILIWSLLKHNGGLSVNDLIKLKHFKNNDIIDKNNFFIIKNENISSKKFFDGTDVLLYPGFVKNKVDVGDIVFQENFNLPGKVLQYYTNSNNSHMLMVNYFVIDDKNTHNFKIPDGYKLVDPIIIHSNVTFLKKSSKKNLKKNAMVGRDSIYNILNDKAKTILKSFRYKNLTKELKNKIYKISNYYEYLKYDFSVLFRIPLYRFYLIFVNTIQKIFNQDYYSYLRNANIFYLNNLTTTEKKLVNFENFEKLDNLIKLYRKKYLKEKDTEKKNNIKKKMMLVINKKKELVKNVKMNFSCTHLIHYIYKIIGINLLYNNSFGIKDINFSTYLAPKDLETIFLDHRFDFIATFKNF